MGGAPSLSGNLFKQAITVGVGDVAVANNPNTVISTYALGSCIGLVLYDTEVKVGGLLHLMLSDSSINPKKAAMQPAMFADTGLTELLRLLDGFRVQRSRLKAFMAGGACMAIASDIFRIGERNNIQIKALLAKLGIPILGEELGGTHNRTLHFTVATGNLEVKTAGIQKFYTFT